MPQLLAKLALPGDIFACSQALTTTAHGDYQLLEIMVVGEVPGIVAVGEMPDVAAMGYALTPQGLA